MSSKKSGSTVERVFELAKPLAEQLGLILWDVRFEKEGSSWYLRVFIDKEGGISMEHCESLSRPLNKLLDETDFIEQSYIFEVGSTGLGRELIRPEHFEQFMGSPVRVRLIRAVDTAKEFIGTLKAFNKDTFSVLCEPENLLEVKIIDCAFVKLNDDDDLFE